MKYKLKELKSNPHRDLQLNPLRENKIESLRESIRETGFWNNVLVRPSDKCIAYGHNRVEAAIREGINEAEFIVREMDDDEMLRIMARENEEGYGGDFITTVESVRALIQAYGAGKLTRPEKLVPAKDTNEQHIRYAPSVIKGVTPPCSNLLQRPYTVAQVADFLGFTYTTEEGRKVQQDKVTAAMRYLELIELKVWSDISELYKYRTVTGAIPVSSVLVAANEAQVKAAARKKIAELGLRKAEGEAITARQMSDQVREVAAIKKEELRVSLDADLAATEGDDEAQAEANKKYTEGKKAVDKEIAAEAKQASKTVEEAEVKVVKAKVELVEATEEEKEKKKETSHDDAATAIIKTIDRRLTSEDSLYADLHRWRRSKFAESNKAQQKRTLMLGALQRMAQRAETFDLFPTKPAEKSKGEK